MMAQNTFKRHVEAEKMDRTIYHYMYFFVFKHSYYKQFEQSHLSSIKYFIAVICL